MGGFVRAFEGEICRVGARNVVLLRGRERDGVRGGGRGPYHQVRASDGRGDGDLEIWSRGRVGGDEEAGDGGGGAVASGRLVGLLRVEEGWGVWAGGLTVEEGVEGERLVGVALHTWWLLWSVPWGRV